MQFSFSEEQQQFRDMLRRFLAETSPTTETRRLMETELGFDRDVWARMSQELGLAGLGIPEAHGGAGFGMVEVCIALEEMGRGITCTPYFATSVLAAKAIEHVASATVQAHLLPQIASGELTATLAVTEPDGSPDLADVTTSAVPADDGYVLNGDKRFVIDGCSADLLLVVGRTPETSGTHGLSLFQVAPDASGLTRTALEVMDPTRKLAHLHLENTPAALLGVADAAASGLQHTLDLAALALANEMVGGAERLLEDTVEYTKLRVQFGRTIASFQAIKHRCTEMLLAVELAKSTAYYAAEAADAQSPELAALASQAKAMAADTYVQLAKEAVQLHGGIGFTWDNDTHLWFKRAKSSEVLLGDPAWHRERMIQNTVDQMEVAQA